MKRLIFSSVLIAIAPLALAAVLGSPVQHSTEQVTSSQNLAAVAGAGFTATSPSSGSCTQDFGFYTVAWGPGPVNMRRGVLTRWIQHCN